MNSDVLKSLGYLKKSLKMSNRAIANAVRRDPNDVVSDKLQDAINDLIDAIDFETSTPSTAIPSSVPVVPVVPVTVVSDPAGNGIDFLVP